MARSGEEDHIQVVLLDEAIEVYVDKPQARTRSPVPEKPVLDVLCFQRLFEKRVVQQVYHPEHQVIAGPPIRVDLPQFFGAERFSRNR
jgi:hypothetical protein